MFAQASPDFHTETQEQERSERCVQPSQEQGGGNFPPSDPAPLAQECESGVGRLGKAASDFCGLLANQRNRLAQICI